MKNDFDVVKGVGLGIKTENILFFDMDGTLIDTDYANFLSYKQAIELVKRQDLNITYNSAQRFNRNLLKTVIPNLTETELEMIVDVKEKCYKNFLSETKLNKELVEILDLYFATNKIVLVTNSGKDRAFMTLRYHKIIDKFSNIFYRRSDGNEEKAINKYKDAISRLGVLPRSIIVFENDKSAIEDAINAGIQIINPKIL